MRLSGALRLTGEPMRMRRVAVVFAAAAVVAFYAAGAHAACRRPDSDALMDHSVIGFVKTLTTMLGRPSARLRWVTVSGTSQMAGGAFVVDCRGKKIAEMDLGFVEVQRQGPLISGKPSLIVHYHTYSGTGINVQNVAILQYRRGHILKLWDHPIFNGSYAPGIEEDEKTYHWRFVSGVSKIEVTGLDTVLFVRNRRIRHDPMADHFCFNSGVMRYLPCR